MTTTHNELITAAADAYQAEIEAEAVAMEASDLYDRFGTDEAYKAMIEAEAVLERASRETWDAEDRLELFEA